MLWQARHASIIISNAIASPNGSNDFYTAADAVSGSQGDVKFIGVCKSLEFKEPEATTNQVPLLGATGTPALQNFENDPQAPTKGELTGTLIMNPEGDNNFDLDKFKHTISGTIATGYATRYNYASASPSAGVAVVVKVTDGTDTVQFLLNNATVETCGGFKVDAEGHFTQDIRVTAAADDCWKEADY